MSVDTASSVIITEPGLYDIPESDYHADPVPGGSLSSSTARKMLPPSCPAIAKWESTHPVFKDCYDTGSVTHALILGRGPEIVEVKADSWRSNAAKDARKDARGRGAVALLSHDLAAVNAMADAVLQHPVAGDLFAGPFLAERSIFWADAETGVQCRAMCDALLLEGPGRPLVVDVKTSPSVAPKSIEKSVHSFGYQQQDDFYTAAVESLGVEDAGFLFVVVQAEPPHLVSVVQLDDDAKRDGYERNRDAIRLWAKCSADDVWPGFNDNDIQTISLPRWARRDYL